MPISKVEEELWRIFSYYTLHADPTQPEQLKVPQFVKFAKDTQIISKHMSQAELQVEMTKEVRDKRLSSHVKTTGYITFTEFINILSKLGKRIYPDCPDAASSLRRLLLENVLLLAARRIPADSLFKDDAEALGILKDTFGRGLQNIYRHYADMAVRRRNQILSNEKAFQDKHPGMVSSCDMTYTQFKEHMKKQKDTIGYIEFFKFTHDFKLKSTALLTAIQVGDIYLTCVPLDEENRHLNVMTFDTFCRSLLLMAYVAYREVPQSASISPSQKVRALLLFMWRCVNSSEKTAKAVTDRYGTSRSVEGRAGSLNIHGSGLFSDMFLDAWQKDNFQSYIAVADGSQTTSGEAIRKLTTQVVPETTVQASIPDHLDSSSVLRDLLAEQEYDAMHEKTNSNLDEVKNVVLHGYQLAELFLKRPELAEFIHMELVRFEEETEL